LRDDLVKVLNQVKQKVNANPCIVTAFLFGSSVKSMFGEKPFSPLSDIDIYIVENPKCSVKTKEWYNDFIGEIDNHKPDVTVLHPFTTESWDKTRRLVWNDIKKHLPVLILKNEEPV